MSLDENGFPEAKNEEIFILQRNNIEFEFEISNIETIREKGKLILSTYRLILISDSPKRCDTPRGGSMRNESSAQRNEVQAFEMPLE